MYFHVFRRISVLFCGFLLQYVQKGRTSAINVDTEQSRPAKRAVCGVTAIHLAGRPARIDAVADTWQSRVGRHTRGEQRRLSAAVYS